MKLLAVDTALGACSVAILDGETVLAHRFVAMARGQAEALAPMVQDAMREAGLAFGDLERLGVTTGPGTFTGQRVGLAFMRGLRLALSRPLVGVTTLDVMAAAALAETDAPAVAVLHDARRGEVYATLRMAERVVLPVQVAEFAVAMAAIAAETGLGPLAFAGTAAEPAAAWYREQTGQAILTIVRQPDALFVARLSALAPEPGETPRPLYLRAPDAVLPKPNIQLRQADRGEIETLAQLHAACFIDAWSAPSFEQLLGGPGVFAVVAERGDQAVGFALGRTAADEAELLSIGVLEAQRRSGLGGLLLRHIAARAAELGAASLFLEVARDNDVARALYCRLGFRQVGQRNNYYREGGGVARDALVLRVPLPLQIPGLGNDTKVD